MSDIQYKNAPLFLLSIAIYLVATAAAEAASTVPVASPSSQFSATPDEVVRKMALQQIGGGVMAPGVSVIQPNGAVTMPNSFPMVQPCTTNPCPNTTASQQKLKATTLAAPVNLGSSAVANPLDIVVANIRNVPTTPLALSKPQYPVTQSPTSVQSPSTTPAQPPLTAQPLATQLPLEKAVDSKQATSLPTTFITKTKAPNRTLLTDLAQLDVGSFGRQFVAKSQSLMLSIRNDSSALLSFGSTRLEISPALSSRLTLSISNNARLSEQLDFDLTQQPITNGKNLALGLLLTDRTVNGRSSFVLSLISTHRFSNKPNV